MASRRIPVANPADPAAPAAGAVRAPPPRAAKSPVSPKPIAVTLDERRALIAERAYLIAEKRGFQPGGENDDWLAAELEIDALLKARHGGSSQ